MGSTSSGKLTTNYSGSKSGQGDTGSGGGGVSGKDQCSQAFECKLEEVEHCMYFKANQDVPCANTPLTLKLDGRLMAVDPNGLSVGALPTSYNYLASCIASGFAYKGHVVSATSGIVASVHVSFGPSSS